MLYKFTLTRKYEIEEYRQYDEDLATEITDKDVLDLIEALDEIDTISFYDSVEDVEGVEFHDRRYTLTLEEFKTFEALCKERGIKAIGDLEVETELEDETED